MLNLKYLLMLTIAVVFSVHADDSVSDDTRSLTQEVIALKVEIKMLREEIIRLGTLVESARQNDKHHGASAQRAKWGCYINDIEAGGVYGVGHTMAEAKGQVLKKCSEKEGACFESNITCTNE